MLTANRRITRHKATHMATDTLTGLTQPEIQELKEDFREQQAQAQMPADMLPEFDEVHCLARIAKQPDEYDGPQRYCVSRNVINTGRAWLCKHHGGATPMDYDLSEEGYDGSDSIKHGMFATQENLIDDFSEKDKALYDWVLREYPKAYDIDLESDPSSQYDLHRLAVEIVRAERGRGWLIQEGEVNETEVRDEDGRIVVDENGEIVTEKSQHYLSDMLHKQDKKITKLEKELGITRKERRKFDQTDDAVDAIKNFAELGTDLLARKEKDFEPEDWDDET